MRLKYFKLAAGMSPRVYRFLDSKDRHHTISHHKGDESKIATICKIDRFHLAEFGRFLRKLKAVDEVDGSLLDSCQILFAGAIGDGQQHRLNRLATLLVGSAGGKWAPGSYQRCEKSTPLANLYLRMMHNAGIDAERFGDSTGPLDLPTE